MSILLLPRTVAEVPESSRPEFDALVPDEAAAEDVLVLIRWPDGVCCPSCGSYDMRRLTTRKLWQCGACRTQTSIRSRWVLHRSKKPLRDWLFAAWRSCTPAGASARSISLELGQRYETTWVMAHKIRASLGERGAWQLEGNVALGTAELTAPKRANGDPPDCPPVLLALVVDPSDPAPDRIRFEVAARPDQTDEELRAVARDRHVHLRPQGELHVDPARIVRPSRGSHALPDAHRRVQGWLTRRFGGVSRKYMSNYLAQFAYTENRAHRREELFVWVLRRMASEPWRPRSDLALAAP